jgi:ankyrin repeat protein
MLLTLQLSSASFCKWWRGRHSIYGKIKYVYETVKKTHWSGLVNYVKTEKWQYPEAIFPYQAVQDSSGAMCQMVLDNMSSYNGDINRDVYFFNEDGSDGTWQHRVTPLILSALYNNIACFNAIMEYKRVRVSKVDEDGKNALHHAAAGGNYEMCNALLEKAESTNDSFKDFVHASDYTEDHQTPLDIAIRFNNAECLRAILEKIAQQPTSLLPQNNWLHIAAQFGDGAICQVFIDKDKRQRGKQDFNRNMNEALAIAVRHQRRQCVEKLLDGGADSDHTLELAKDNEMLQGNVELHDTLTLAQKLKLVKFSDYVGGYRKKKLNSKLRNLNI